MRNSFKFRCWDTETLQFISTDLIEINGNGRISYAHGKSVGGDGINGERFIIQFSTGLKDKWGQDVYEGDIVRQIDGKFPTFVIEGTVQYDTPNAAFIIHTKNGQTGLGSAETYLEIIGNIFEYSK